MKNMDNLLNQALTPENEPDYWLIQNTLSQAKEVTPMKKTTRKKYVTAILSCLTAVVITSISVYAAWTYLKPDQIVRDWGESELADAFQGEDAVYINETQSYGGYRVTLLGFTSGKDLTGYQYSIKYSADGTSVTRNGTGASQTETEDGTVPLTSRTYVLFAIEGERLEPWTDFTAFPVVMGYDYETYDSMFGQAAGSRQEQIGDTLYFMYECNNLELFADHEIYMCVSDDLPVFSEYSYLYDNDSGILERNEEYEGLNALFSLPLDAAKADPKAAAEMAAAFEQHQRDLLENEVTSYSTEWSSRIKEAFAFVEQITPDNINEYATPLTEEGSVQTFVPDSQGRIDVRFGYQNSNRSKPAVKDLFPDGKTGYVSYTGISGDNPDSILVEYYTLNEDGSVTLQLYKPNLPE